MKEKFKKYLFERRKSDRRWMSKLLLEDKFNGYDRRKGERRMGWRFSYPLRILDR